MGVREGRSDCSHLIVTVQWLLENFYCWFYHAMTSEPVIWIYCHQVAVVFISVSLNYRTGIGGLSNVNRQKNALKNLFEIQISRAILSLYHHEILEICISNEYLRWFWWINYPDKFWTSLSWDFKDSVFAWLCEIALSCLFLFDRHVQCQSQVTYSLGDRDN